MSISQSAGTRFIPMLSRIVLGAKLFLLWLVPLLLNGDFTPAQRTQIKAMQAGGPNASSTQLVRWQWDGVVDAAKSQSKAAGDSDQVKSPDDAATSKAGDRAVYQIALDLQYWGIQKGLVPLAWGIAVFEIVAGALVFLGLFTRLWGLLAAHIDRRHVRAHVRPAERDVPDESVPLEVRWCALLRDVLPGRDLRARSEPVHGGARDVVPGQSSSDATRCSRPSRPLPQPDTGASSIGKNTIGSNASTGSSLWNRPLDGIRTASCSSSLRD